MIVSPHLDDAVLSVGATIAHASRAGASVEVLSVFAGDPASTTPAAGWDRRAGFETEGAAAAARREEDQAACAIVGARGTALTFPLAGYKRPRDPDLVHHAVAEAAAAPDALLVPGFPLVNDDHRWLHELLLARRLPCGRLVLYAEQPYRYSVRRERPTPGPPFRWSSTGARLGDLRLKRGAVLAYRSQLPLLGLERRRHLQLHRLLLHEALHGGEAVAEVPA